MRDDMSGDVGAARTAADLYNQTREDVIAEPVGSLARRLHSALGDLANAVLVAAEAPSGDVGADVALTDAEREALNVEIDDALDSWARGQGWDDRRLDAVIERIIAARVEAAKAEALREAAEDAVTARHQSERWREQRAWSVWLRARADTFGSRP